MEGDTHKPGIQPKNILIESIRLHAHSFTASRISPASVINLSIKEKIIDTDITDVCYILE